MNIKQINAKFNLPLLLTLAGATANIASPLSDWCPREAATLGQDNGTLDEESLPQDSSEREARLSKNTRYNGGGCEITTVTSTHPCFFDQVLPRGLPLVPLQETSIAFTGQVSRIQPYLSADRTHIYTEIAIRIEEIFKSPADYKLPRDKTIIVTQIGGTLRIRSGQVVHDGTRIDFLGKMAAGGRYMVFARKIHANKDVTLVRAYELRDGQVYKLTDDGTPSTIPVSSIPGIANTSSEEKAFLQSVSKAAAGGAPLNYKDLSGGLPFAPFAKGGWRTLKLQRPLGWPTLCALQRVGRSARSITLITRITTHPSP